MTRSQSITILFDKRDFEYDVYSLVKAFYPAADVKVRDGDEAFEEDGLGISVFLAGEGSIGIRIEDQDRGVLFDDSCPGDPEDRTEYKSSLKALLYKALAGITGRTLPWGDLTGIRPVKLISSLLKEGRSDEQILDYMENRYFVSPQKAALGLDIAKREERILAGLSPDKGFSLYVSIPFCPTICLYCSFSSSPLKQWEKRVDEYIDALCAEIAMAAPLMRGQELQSVYMGGGTPTTLTPEQMERLLKCIEAHFDLGMVREFTVEAGRPDTITPEKLKVLRDHPVTRLSVNPQTMNQKTLDTIGRRHGVEDVKRAFAMARDQGFDNINMDLILGLPGEGREEVAHTMEEIKALSPQSVTVHSLALKRATRLHLMEELYRDISFVNDDKIMDITMRACHEMGLKPYYLYRQKNMAGNFENTGYALPGMECLYNILIMEEVQSILAVGAGASTKRVFPSGLIQRVENLKDINGYIQRTDEMVLRKEKLFTTEQE